MQADQLRLGGRSEARGSEGEGSRWQHVVWEVAKGGELGAGCGIVVRVRVSVGVFVGVCVWRIGGRAAGGGRACESREGKCINNRLRNGLRSV